MTNHAGRWKHGVQTLLFALALTVPAIAQGQSASSSVQEQARASDAARPAPSTQYTAGQAATIEGTILKREADGIIVQTLSGTTASVDITGTTKVTERKSNPFRHARNYAVTQLLPGLAVQVKGRGTGKGSLAAEEIRFTNDDLKVAALMDSRITPVEGRLTQEEQNAMRLSGQVSELSAVSNAARGGAKAAQETADSALESAQKANSSADRANSSADAAKEALDKVGEETKIEKGYLVEVAGFASAEGNAEYNRVLSQRRADAVIRYLAEKNSIPLRRFITPFGYGSLQPVADNHTRAGRVQNRRVEVRVLVSKGLSQQVTSTTTAASH